MSGFLSSGIVNADAIPDSGVSRFNLEAGSGTTASDIWNGYDGDISGATWENTDPYDSYSLAFDPLSGSGDLSGDRVERDGTPYQFTGDFTFTAWVNANSTEGSGDSNGNAIIAVSDSSTNRADTGASTIFFDNSNGVRFRFSGSDILENGSPANEWLLVFGRRSGSTIELGRTRPSTSVTIVGIDTNSDSITANTLSIGNAHAYAPFHGNIADSRVYNKSLSDTEINNISNGNA